jgi:hypothetical protein
MLGERGDSNPEACPATTRPSPVTTNVSKKEQTMSKDLKRTIEHGLHVAMHTESGKRAVKVATGAALAATTAVVGATAAPFVVTGVICYGLWRLWKKK